MDQSRNTQHVPLAHIFNYAYNTPMPANDMKQQSLILYKNKPGIIQKAAKKVDIKLIDGDSLSVRPKDVLLLHPGPIHNFNELTAPDGDVEIAWELLAGETTTLPDLAELAFDEYTPASAWAVWQLVEDGLYFSGDVDDITVHTAVSVDEIKATRAAKEQEEAEWNAFLARIEQNEFAPEDGRFLEDVVALALGKRSNSRTLKALGQSETPEHAHTLLLKINNWDETINPYPSRMEVNLEPPNASLPDLPDEARRDLTHLPAFAIDDEGSTDADDALSWENGRFWIHVADVAALIPPDSPADLEARDRASNLYLPETTIHMLPEAATDALALGRSERSPALSFGLDIADDGTITNVEIVPSWVRVTKVSYEEADGKMDESPFAEMSAITDAYEAQRNADGAINIDLPEVRIRLDEAGEIVIRPIRPLRSRNMVREAMLMAGEATAQYAIEHSIPLPFTTQDPPKGDVDTPETPSGMFARRKAMNRSQQSTQPGKHTGLGMEPYVQCTSPLRRYLDLVVHQQLRAYLAQRPLLDEAQIMERIGATQAIVGNMRRAERQSNAHWTLVYLQRQPEWQGEGVVIEQRGKRSTVLIPELEWEAQVYMQNDTALDTAVTIKLTGIDLPNLEASFSVTN